VYGGSVLGTSTVAAGVVVLPNTGENHVLFIVALASIIIGSLIILSTIIRFIAKKVYKA
jgi:LPXTG-motif cell wall-anchored protein